MEQASCKDNTVGDWEGAERDWSTEAYGRECEVECSSWQKRSPTLGHEWTMQGNGPECFQYLVWQAYFVLCMLLNGFGLDYRAELPGESVRMMYW